MMLLLALVHASIHDVKPPDSPVVWIAPTKGRLERAGRDGDSPQLFDVYPDVGSVGFRNRQLGFVQGGLVTWITAAGGTAHGATQGQELLGWTGSDPILWDGHHATQPSGAAVKLPLKDGEQPVFAILQPSAGLFVATDAEGRLRIELSGAHSISASFGKWRLASAQMWTPSSGLLLLEGAGYAVVLIRPGRADVVDIDAVNRLGIGVGSDRRFYDVRHSRSTDLDQEESEVNELPESGAPVHYCTIVGDCDVVDIDRAKSRLYLLRHGADSNEYLRVDANGQEVVTLREHVRFVLPAFSGAGFVHATPN